MTARHHGWRPRLAAAGTWRMLAWPAADGAPGHRMAGRTGAQRGRGEGMSAGQPGHSGTKDPAVADSAAAGQARGPLAAPDVQVPRLLRQAAAWSWRILLVGLAIYLAFRAASALRLVVLPLIAALLLTALLQPLTSRLRRVGMPSLAATWCTALIAILVVAALGFLAASRVGADYPILAAEAKRTTTDVQHYLAGPPFHLNGSRLQQLASKIGQYLAAHKSAIAGTVLTGGKIFLEFATGLILMLFITFFLLKDGDRIFGWLISGLPPDARGRAGRAGAAAWQALVNYVRGTTAVAAIHAIFIGLALWLLGVPLLAPLIIAVFLAAFVPLIGILMVGAVAILVTLATQGWLAAVILLAVFLAENQIESHLLQPLVVGRLVRLHPLGIILVLTAGGIIAGIPGAIVAVPAAAVVFYAWPQLRGSHDPAPAGSLPSSSSAAEAGVVGRHAPRSPRR